MAQRTGARLKRVAVHKQVEAWLEREARGLGPSQRLRLLSDGLAAVWSRAEPTLGGVTLHAVGRRVLLTASESSSQLEIVSLGPGGFQLDALLERNERAATAIEADLRTLLEELLGVLSAITSGVLEPVLHQALTTVTGRTDKPPAPAAKGRRRK